MPHEPALGEAKALGRLQMGRLADSSDFEALLWAFVYREGPVGLAELQSFACGRREELEAALERLVALNKMATHGQGEAHRFSAERLEVLLEAEVGWETAVFDHYRAMVQTICQRLTRSLSGEPPQRTGGSTFTLDVWQGHPLAEQAYATLARFRSEHAELYERVEAYNAENGCPDEYDQVVSKNTEGSAVRVYGPGVQRLCAIACFVNLTCATSSVLAVDPGKPATVAWQPGWRKVQPFEYAATLVLGASAIGISFLVDPPTRGRYGGVLFDGSVRNALRAETRSGRDTARTIGDLGYRALAIFPLADGLLSWAIHRDAEVAWQMIAMDLEAIAVSGFIGLATDHFIGRARPSAAPCHDDANYERFCNAKDEFSSFVSGHSVIAAAAAGVTCAHHLSLPLYGGGAGDIAACAVTSALALTTGVARIVNDRHWATDVTFALAAGAAVGYLWPRLFHYRRWDLAGDAVSFSVYPTLAVGVWSGTVAGAF